MTARVPGPGCTGRTGARATFLQHFLQLLRRERRSWSRLAPAACPMAWQTPRESCKKKHTVFTMFTLHPKDVMKSMGLYSFLHFWRSGLVMVEAT